VRRIRKRKPLPKWRNVEIAQAIAALRAEGFRIKEDVMALYFSQGTTRPEDIDDIRNRFPQLRKITFRIKIPQLTDGKRATYFKV